MDRATYAFMEGYMLREMGDSAHDKEHIYRVLYVALDIAAHESGVDYDVLIAAALLHDTGRREQFENPSLCHAAVGAEKARRFLTGHGFSGEYAERVAACIRSHRFRSEDPPESLEAKILFDADKIDVSGALGIARTLMYTAEVNEPLYSLLPDGQVSDGSGDAEPSFFQEYKYKLEGLYSQFCTARGAAIARSRQTAATAFYERIKAEVNAAYQAGAALLKAHIG